MGFDLRGQSQGQSQMRGERFLQVAAINIKTIYKGEMGVAKIMALSDLTSEVKVRGQL